MTEQQRVSAMYEKLPPEKQAVFLMMVQTITNMMAILVTLSEDKR